MLRLSPAARDLARRPTLRLVASPSTPKTAASAIVSQPAPTLGQAKSTGHSPAQTTLPTAGEPAGRNALLELDPGGAQFKANLEAKYSAETRDVWAGIVRLVARRVVQHLLERGVPEGQVRSLAAALLPDILQRVAARLRAGTDDAVPDTTPGAIAGFSPMHLTSERWSSDGPSLNDVRQGGLGDCYFLAALAGVVTEDQEIIRNGVLPHRDTRGNIVAGQYDVRLYVQGAGVAREQWITVSDIMLRDGGYNEAYAQTTDNDHDGAWEHWVALYEKAYAVLRGAGDVDRGYREAGKGGWGGEAYFALTGRPMLQRDPSMMDGGRLLDILDRANPADGSVVLVGTRGKSDREDIAQGLPANHMYQVLGTYADEWSGEPMVTLRNPWGHYEPNDSELMRTANGTVAADVEPNDGIFSIPLSQLQRDFDLVAYVDE